MNCQVCRERLSEYLDGALDAAKIVEVEAHLAACVDCRETSHAIREGIQAVADLPAIEPPTGFTRRVMNRIRKENQKPTLWHALFYPIRIKIPLHATALLLIAGLAVYLYQIDQPLQRMVDREEPALEKKERLLEPSENRPKFRNDITTKNLRRESSLQEKTKESNEAIDLRKRAVSPPASDIAESDKKDLRAQSELTEKVVSFSDVMLTLLFDGPADKEEQFLQKIADLARGLGGEPIQQELKASATGRASFRIPRKHYGRFKEEIAVLMRIESETDISSSRRLNPPPSPLSEAEKSLPSIITVMIEIKEAP
ncbi:MAG: anti-sigma factor family protein [Nitrospiria bacterium]